MHSVIIVTMEMRCANVATIDMTSIFNNQRNTVENTYLNFYLLLN